MITELQLKIGIAVVIIVVLVVGGCFLKAGSKEVPDLFPEEDMDEFMSQNYKDGKLK